MYEFTVTPDITTSEGLIVSIVILLAGGLVIFEFIREVVLGQSDIYTKEEACKVMNQISGKTDINLAQKAAIKGCSNINLGVLPMKRYNQNKEGVMKNIADKIAKAWDIWREGTQENNFAGTMWPAEGTIYQDRQRCFIQYRFEIKKGIDPIKSVELLEYLNDNLYHIDDTSDRCAGTDGGYCREVCPDGERKVNAVKTCIGEENTCCLKKETCESKGGTCEEACGSGRRFYSNHEWTCEKDDICCVDNSNYISYLNYIQANTGSVRIETDLLPQDFSKDKDKISETYAIVFSSRTTVFLEPEEKDNVNNILIAPLDKVHKYCNPVTPTSA